MPPVPLVRKCCVASRLGGAGQAWRENTRRQLEERRRIETDNKGESTEHRRAVVERLWPHVLDSSGPKRETRNDLGFRQFTGEELQAIYERKE
jgi:hypothetical protein